jgi:hypothetical protein
MLEVWTDSGEIPMLETDEKTGRLVVVLADETGCESLSVDLNDLIGWLWKHKPELLANWKET